MRVWLPDRPGALGAVASRIGAVRGDVVGIDILETGDGVAVDELVVAPARGHARSTCWWPRCRQVDGVTSRTCSRPTPPVATLASTPSRRPPSSAAPTPWTSSSGPSSSTAVARWACRGRRSSTSAPARSGPCRAPPPAMPGWRPSWPAPGPAATTPCWARATWPGPRCPAVDLALVGGRSGTPFRAKERRQVAALARVAGTRAREVGVARSRRSHPSAAS